MNTPELTLVLSLLTTVVQCGHPQEPPYWLGLVPDQLLGVADDNCTGTNKQKALYLDYEIEPTLQDSPALDMEVIVVWNSTKDVRRFGQNGVFAAHPIDFGDGVGGYFGSQVDGNSSEGGLLFSIWDEKPGSHANTSQCDHTNAPNVTWCMDKHAFPLVDNCKRHCLDCGLHPGWHNTTGTQCSVPMTINEGDAFSFRLFRKQNGTKLNNPLGMGLDYIGSVWELKVSKINLTTREEQTPILLGRMFFERTFDGVTRFGAFHEHIGCTPCDSFYESEIRVGPVITSPDPRVVKTIGFTRKNVTCELYDVDILNSTKIPAAQFRTGPGTGPNPVNLN